MLGAVEAPSRVAAADASSGEDGVAEASAMPRTVRVAVVRAAVGMAVVAHTREAGKQVVGPRRAVPTCGDGCDGRAVHGT